VRAQERPTLYIYPKDSPMKLLKILVICMSAITIFACGGGSGGSGGDSSPDIVVDKISMAGIELTIIESIAVGTLLEGKLNIQNGPVDISNISLELTGAGSEYFSVSVVAGGAEGDYLGNISLTQSLLGLGGGELSFTASLTAGDKNLTAPIVINLSKVDRTLTAYQHADIFTKGTNRLNTSETESDLTTTQPKHGSVEAYYVGNEFWDFNYTSTDCFEGEDTYLYQTGGEYGEVSITINPALKDLSINVEAGSTKTIDLAYDLLMIPGQTITVTQPSNGVSAFNSEAKQLSYTPNSSATSDSFTYAANGCAKTVTVNVTQPPQFLSLKTAAEGRELWNTDGTVAGTVLVKDINVGTGSSNPSSIVKRESDGMYFFTTHINGIYSIYKTDGAEANTNLVLAIPQADTARHMSDLIVEGDTIFFTTKSNTTFKLWKSNGISTGTVVVKELTATGGDASGYLNSINGKAFFNYDSSTYGEEAWISDGSALGTVILKNIWSGSGDSDFAKGSVIKFNGKLFSEADDGSGKGSEVWMTDGTSAGTELLKDIEVGSDGSLPADFVVADDVFYFTAFTTGVGTQLWKSDGTSANTVAVKDMDPNSTLRDIDMFGGDFLYGNVKQAGVDKGLLFFAAKNGDYGIELWKSDGTDSGTTMVKDLMAGVNYSSRPRDFVEFDHAVYFSAAAVDNSRNLWKTDGTEAGTVMIKSFGPDELRGIEQRGTFLLLDIQKGSNREVWRSDGTASGTYLLKTNGSIFE